MKTVRVVAAVICSSLQRKEKVFATARGYGNYKGMWEFPGGKIETGEDAKDALKREISGELDAEIEVGELIETVEWDYPEFHLRMHCYVCHLVSEDICLNEHEAAAWLTKQTLHSVKWLPADEGLINTIEEVYLRKQS